MGECCLIRITIGEGDTERLPITLRAGERILRCMSHNTRIVTCSNHGTFATITGHKPGTTIVKVLIGFGSLPVRELVFLVTVIEQNEE